MRTEIAAARFSGPAAALAHLQAVESDLRAVGRITGEVELDGVRRPAPGGRQPRADILIPLHRLSWPRWPSRPMPQPSIGQIGHG